MENSSQILNDYIQEHIQVGSIKVGTHVFIKGFSCRIAHITFAKTGKHGSAKAMMFGYDILTDKKHENSTSTTNTMMIPIVKKYTWGFIDFDKESNEMTTLTDV